MIRLKKIIVCSGLCLMVVVDLTGMSWARQNTLSAQLGLNQEFDSNIFHAEDDREEQWRTMVAPSLSLDSQGSNDLVSLTYSVDMAWDQRRDQHDFDHHLGLTASREMARGLQVSIGNDYSYNDASPRTDMLPNNAANIASNFARANQYGRQEVARLLFPEIIYSDEEFYVFVVSEISDRYTNASAAVQQEVDRFLSNTDGRRRSWQDDFTLSLDYEFGDERVLIIGYRYGMVDDRSANISESDEHSSYISLSYRFNPRWLGSCSYDFTNTRYDNDGDRRQHDTTLGLEHNLTLADVLAASFAYGNSIYDGSQGDFVRQSSSVSWNHAFSPLLEMTVSLGGDFLHRDDSADERGADLGLAFNGSLAGGTYSLGGDLEFDERKEAGDWDQARRNWSVAAGINYSLFEDITADLNISFAKRYEWTGAGVKESFDDYGLGAGVSWQINRWLSLTGDYTYSRLDTTDGTVDDFYEHQVVVGLSAGKELFKW